jgi:hypothetical protein
MTMLHWNTITETMRSILREFSRTEIASGFYLAGGTALSLQLGHRRSVDLDFFSSNQDVPTIRPILEDALAPLRPILADSAWGNLVYLAKDVRLGFYGYGFPLVAPLVEADGMKLASVEDIGLMKLDTLLSRATRKDFYDLYFICRNIDLTELLKLAPRKFANVRDFETQAVKRLTYFDNAESDLDPVLLQTVPWQTVKDFFVRQAREIGSTWL